MMPTTIGHLFPYGAKSPSSNFVDHKSRFVLWLDRIFAPYGMPITDLLQLPVYPKPLAEMIVRAMTHGWPEEAVMFDDPG